jgi:hypothetical protein
LFITSPFVAVREALEGNGGISWKYKWIASQSERARRP